MHLTEPPGGHGPGRRALHREQAPDGTWRLTGQKIFITWGEHDFTDNIVHLILARTKGGAGGG